MTMYYFMQVQIIMFAMSITKDEVSDLIKVNNQQSMDSFKDLIQDTAGHIKKANRDAAGLQMDLWE